MAQFNSKKVVKYEVTLAPSEYEAVETVIDILKDMYTNVIEIEGYDYNNGEEFCLDETDLDTIINGLERVFYMNTTVKSEND